MRKILAATFSLAVVGLMFGAALAEPSQRCDGTTPTSPPVETKAGSSEVALCSGVPGFKGAVYCETAHRSCVADGDRANSSTNSCLDGYFGVHGEGTPHLVSSQGSDFNPTAPESDGGTAGTDPGSPHDHHFVTAGETAELANCR